MKFLQYLTRGTGVNRYHTYATLIPQNVGNHSARVAWLCWYLSNCAPSATLLMAALDHDMPEYETGDIPAHSKRAMSAAGLDVNAMEDAVRLSANMAGFENLLTDAERIILKKADRLDGMLYCLEERGRGNQGLREVYFAYVRLLAELPTCAATEELVKHIGDLYDDYDR